MTHGITLADAEKLLSGETRMQRLLDQLSGPAADIGAIVPGLGLVMSALGLCRDLAPGLSSLFEKAGTKIRKAPRRERAEILTAVHAIVVIASYFEALVEAEPIVRTFELTKEDQIRAAKGSLPDQWFSTGRPLISTLFELTIEAPSPYCSYRETVKNVALGYLGLSTSLRHFLAGLASWDTLSETERGRLDDALGVSVPEAAVARYERQLRTLAAQHTEFGLWLCLGELAAASGERHEQSLSLAALHELLVQSGASAVAPEGIRLALSRAHKAGLSRPVIDAGYATIPSSLRIPNLDEVYVDPAFRVALIDADACPADEHWWKENVALRQDLAGFLAGHLTAAEATMFPLVVLGHPGAGKSLLTKVLAARVPAALFPPVRVELRRVNADAPLRDQIEAALRELTGEHLTWASVGRAAAEANAVPLVLLDGFDELLQSTGMSQSSYLEQVSEFQRVEADQGRPVAVMVTSRTVVAHQMRFPEGCPVVKLDPFDESRIASWLKVWNEANAAYFSAKSLTPLQLETVRGVIELGEQPLLLLMLALYDADGNALRRPMIEFGQAELYEGLLLRFVRREVEKDPVAPRLTENQIQTQVEQRLSQLAVVAFAMFNRGSQSVRVHDLHADVVALAAGHSPQAVNPLALSDTELVAGRFFFVHEASATVGKDAGVLRTYEFLHATFGEYLIARESMRMLQAIVAARQQAYGYAVTSTAEPRLRALLSFAPLTGRQPIRAFAAQIGAGLGREVCQELKASAIGLFGTSLTGPNDRRFDAYLPTARDMPYRHAVYALNLATLVLAVSDGWVDLTDLFAEPDGLAAADRWRRLSALWHACLSAAEWSEAVNTLTLHINGDLELPQPVALAVRAAGLGSTVDSHRPGQRETRLPDAFNALAILADPTTDALLGLSVPLGALPALYQGVSVPHGIEWPISEHGYAAARCFLDLVVGRPFAAQTLVLGFDACISAFRRMPPQESESFAPLIAKALLARVDQIPVAEAVRILVELAEGVRRFVRSSSVEVFEADLALFDTAVALLGRAGVGLSIAAPMYELIGNLDAAAGKLDRLRFLARLYDTGISLNLVADTRPVLAGLPALAELTSLAADNPAILGEAIRLAGRCKFLDWLVDVGLPAVEGLVGEALLRLAEDVFSIVLQAAERRADTRAIFRVKAVRKRRDNAREKYFGAN